MAQMSIYIDEETLENVRRAAEREGKSVSEWVRSRLNRSLEEEWPEGYFEVFGVLEEGDLDRPDQVPFTQDATREEL